MTKRGFLHFPVLLFCLFLSPAHAGEWATDPENGCQAWNPKPQANETISWSGACVDGKAEGFGVHKFLVNGETQRTCECHFVAGRQNGKGVASYPNGSRLEANFVNDVPEGKGSLLWADGSRYEGDFLQGKRTGKGQLAFASGNRYEGDFLEGKLHGRGSFTWADGNRYEGDFVEGKRSGKGIFIWKNGDRYEGVFVDGKRTGSATYVWASGERYVGNFLDGKKDGYGEETAKNGRLRRGLWKLDKLERSCGSDADCADMKAEYLTPLANCKVNDSDIGKEYRGECRNGLAHGQGRAKGQGSYVGEFREGMKHGKGKLTLPKGDVYTGEFKADKFSGQGKYAWSTDRYYEGDFLNGNFHGFGLRTYNCNCGFWSCDICSEQGWWENDKLVRSCNSKNACIKLIRLEPEIRKAEKTFRCEDARKLNQELEALNAGIFYFDSCVRERRFANLLQSSDPQEMYLAAGRYESDGERSRAKTVYRQIMDRFAKNPLAIKAADRLTRLADVDAIETSQRSVAARVEGAQRDAREAAYQQCMNNLTACYSSCDNLRDSSSRSSCKSGCALCSR